MRRSIYLQFISLLLVSIVLAGAAGYGFYYTAKNKGFMVKVTEDLEGAIVNHELEMMRLKERVNQSILAQRDELEASVADNWIDIALEQGYIKSAPSAKNQTAVYNRFINSYITDKLGPVWYEKALANIDNVEQYELYILNLSREIIYSQNSRWSTNDEIKKNLSVIISNSYREGYNDGQYTYLYSLNIGNMRYYLVTIKDIEPDTVYDYSECVYCAVAVGSVIFLIIMIVGISSKIRYIRYLADTAKRISDGEKDVHIDLKGRDELEDVAHNLNEMYESLNASIEQEAKNAEDTRTLMTNLSHDLKTPITIISGYLDVAKKEKDPEIVREYVDKASEYSDKMIVMVHNMLEAFGKNKYDNQKTVMDLSIFIEQTVWEYEGSEELFEADIEKNIMFNYDMQAMRMLLCNILDNAIKYSNGKGKIKILFKREASDVVLKVSNPAEVIAKEDLDKIFDRFYRTDKSRNSQTEGNGLGLAIVKDIAQQHNGCVRAEYERGEFSIYVIFKNSGGI